MYVNANFGIGNYEALCDSRLQATRQRGGRLGVKSQPLSPNGITMGSQSKWCPAVEAPMFGNNVPSPLRTLIHRKTLTYDNETAISKSTRHEIPFQAHVKLTNFLHI
uniref:Uncharacterized protein ycf45-like n=1 Tax=Rhizophora mucronata TaxID=61149 RepID=A0A2P2L3N8_RHIMU